LHNLTPNRRITRIELFHDVVFAASMLLIYGILAKGLSGAEFHWLSTIARVDGDVGVIAPGEL
jgi:hypothetical protein